MKTNIKHIIFAFFACTLSTNSLIASPIVQDLDLTHPKPNSNSDNKPALAEILPSMPAAAHVLSTTNFINIPANLGQYGSSLALGQDTYLTIDKNVAQQNYETGQKPYVSVAFKLQKQFSEQLEFALSAMSANNLMEKQNDLASFKYGALLKWNGLTLSGSYGSDEQKNLESYLTNSQLKSNYLTAGISYEYKKAMFSVNYTHSNLDEIVHSPIQSSLETMSDVQKQNWLISASARYKLLPGIIPFLETGYYNINFSNSKFMTASQDRKTHKGVVVFTGAQVNF